jgi:hypothetical protein
LFITQDFAASGKYYLITNTDGRFEVISVDDHIPINRKTLEPIWGVSYRNPWELILLKAWAKKLQGYDKIKTSRPFEFIESFSNATWKYFNLTKSPDLFLKKYSNFIRTKNAKIVLKSKDGGNVLGNGFLPDSATF